MDSSLSLYFEHVYICNDTKCRKKLHVTFVQAELLIDGPEEHQESGWAFIRIYWSYDTVYC
jgi:hypothetical protein